MKKTITVDGNYACAKIAYYMSEVACIYPITPSSPMAENCDQWRASGKKNLFGNSLRISELQSEAGASGALHGSLLGGALSTTFTASQGLLLMIPNMYKIAGELLPLVIHTSARTVATHALSIFGDHSDVMAVRQTGFAMLASSNVQECLDLALVAHLASLKSSVPFLHFFDGFRTSHEVQKIYDIDEKDIDKIIDFEDIEKFKSRALTPTNPKAKGTTQNPDCYFQNLEARNIYYKNLPAIVKQCMEKVQSITGRKYNLADYFGTDDAEKIIVIMASGGDTVCETVAYLNDNKSKSSAGITKSKVGVIKIRLYRPFPIKEFLSCIPYSCKQITVLDRTKEFGSLGEPLYLDVLSALEENKKANIKVLQDIKVLSGRYGISSKEFTPSMVKAVFDNMIIDKNDNKTIDKNCSKNYFSVGIDDDITHNSLEIKDYIDTTPKSCICCKFYGLGSDGTVSANKNSIKIIGGNTNKFAQAYFAYDSKKSGGLTISHLRFGDKPINSPYLIEKADFLACHNASFIKTFDMLKSLKKGGTFLLNSELKGADLEAFLPFEFKQYIIENNINFYVIDAFGLAQSLGLKNKISTIMQACFFRLANIIPYENAVIFMKDYVKKTFEKKGENIVKINCQAIDNAQDNLIKIELNQNILSTKNSSTVSDKTQKNTEYFNNYCTPILKGEGDNLKVSDFACDGSVPTATTQYEKRGTASIVAKWLPENCIQCNQCAIICPHSCIRPILIKKDDNNQSNKDTEKNKTYLSNNDTPDKTDKNNCNNSTDKLPNGFITIEALGAKDYGFRIQITPLDCTGCGSCINVCPAPQKALEYAPLFEQEKEQKQNWELVKNYENDKQFINKTNLKGCGFARPLFEFSGACAGCGETQYIRLATALFGEKMIIANATGCSSIYGGSSPTCPYSKNNEGKGPAWANSLFEDNAEFGYGIYLAHKTRRENLKNIATKLLADGFYNKHLESWLKTFDDKQNNPDFCRLLQENLSNMLKTCKIEKHKILLEKLAKDADALNKKSIWIIGGDGWAYDIGYGGLDHILASGEDVNILVLDTEVYSNTGGQASKATQTGAVAKFCEDGKKTEKKDLGLMAINYGNVYTASVAIGANMSQCLKAFNEAESYNGVSLIIAYSPCISHGINMSNCMLEERRAVDFGYWNLFRFNPNNIANKFVLDCKQPQGDYLEFLNGETRFKSLAITNPEECEKLFKANEKQAKERFEKYLKLVDFYK